MTSLRNLMSALASCNMKEYNRHRKEELEKASTYLNKPIPGTSVFQELFLEEYRYKMVQK